MCLVSFLNYGLYLWFYYKVVHCVTLRLHPSRFVGLIPTMAACIEISTHWFCEVFWVSSVVLHNCNIHLKVWRLAELVSLSDPWFMQVPVLSGIRSNTMLRFYNMETPRGCDI